MACLHEAIVAAIVARDDRLLVNTRGDGRHYDRQFDRHFDRQYDRHYDRRDDRLVYSLC